MTNTALAMSFAERTAYAGKMLLIGLGTVFAALAVLMAVLMIFRKVVEEKSEKPAKSEGKAPAAPANDELMAVITAAVAAAQADEGALVAAITAAVAATLAEENGGIAPAFRVVSFRPVKTVSNKK